MTNTDAEAMPGAKRTLPFLGNNGQGVNRQTLRGPLPALPGQQQRAEPDGTRAEKFPAPWFGGKSAAASTVWAALGDPEHYCEPFCATAAVLLARPGGPEAHYRGYHSETVNDIDGLLVNAWRAIQMQPALTAQYAAWPVSEADLHARHQYLIRWKASGELERMMADPFRCDPMLAGWWLWGQSAWIGSGWCSGRGPWITWPDAEGVPTLTDRRELRRAAKAADGQTSDADTVPGACRQLPHLTSNGQGVNMQTLRGPLPDMPDADAWDAVWPGGTLATASLTAWFRRLADRMRNVRILNGDWKRLCTNGALRSLSVRREDGVCGVFLDPPYADTAGRDSDVYSHDDERVAHDVRDWCLKMGGEPWLRIVLAGFESEHDDANGVDMLQAAGWRCVEWYKNGFLTGGMGNIAATSQARRERLWLSPHCLDLDAAKKAATPDTTTAVPLDVLPMLELMEA